MSPGLICALLVSATPATPHAQPAELEGEDLQQHTLPDARYRKKWYGWQTIIPDVASSFRMNGSLTGGVLLGGAVVSILDALFLGYTRESVNA